MKYPKILMQDVKFKTFYTENILKASKLIPNLTRRVTKGY